VISGKPDGRVLVTCGLTFLCGRSALLIPNEKFLSKRIDLCSVGTVVAMVTIMCGKCGHVFADEQLDAASARAIEAARSAKGSNDRVDLVRVRRGAGARAGPATALGRGIRSC
jgi:hypothetical protein